MTEELTPIFSKPSLPLTWDYSVSVKDVVSGIHKWKNLTEEMACELWIAREMIKKEFDDWQMEGGTKVPPPTWDSYCNDIGSVRRVVNRWLSRWFDKPHIAQNSGENEWYTPMEYVESARLVMGSIDTDPASNEFMNQFIKAETYYTKETDGTNKTWEGNVWLNPPYSQPEISKFSDAVIGNKHSFNQATILVNNATDTAWLQDMMQECNAMCFLRGRIKFIDKDGEPSGAPLQGQAVLYFGENIEEFYNEFTQYGICMMRMKEEEG